MNLPINNKVSRKEWVVKGQIQNKLMTCNFIGFKQRIVPQSKKNRMTIKVLLKDKRKGGKVLYKKG
jgi:hypothetical protein